MLYWLYTVGLRYLSPFLPPLLCLTLLLPIVLSLVMGRGIKRSESGGRATALGWRKILMLFTFVVVLFAVTAAYLGLTRNMALARSTGGKPLTSEILIAFTGGPASINKQRLLMLGSMCLFLDFMALATLRELVRDGGWLRERIDRMRRPGVMRGAMGSAHFCSFREYRRFRVQDPEGMTFYGAFWGQDRKRMDIGFGRFCLNGEDAARGVLTLGGPGSGKTQSVILPAIADRMQLGHSLIVADPQGELTQHVLGFAKATGHLVVIHDPTSRRGGAHYNLAEGLTNVSDARAIANVLIPTSSGDNRFWSDSATALLAACLIEFDNLGDIYSALRDLKQLAELFQKNPGDAALLANSFIASVGSDGKVASNVVATLATALTGWADAVTRANTSDSDFDADLIVSRPVVVMLTCPGRMRDVYASYLGATLRKLMLDLDTIGEQNRNPKRPSALPTPVGIILDEFPTLGKLDSIIKDVNLVRKRRISILIGAQSKGQFHSLYGPDGTQTLFAGMATQIVFGAVDHETAEFYSKASGTTTVDANPDPAKANLRQRPLLTTDEITTPQDGNATIFARYVEPAFATQVVLTAQLTRLYERSDWKTRINKTKNEEPLILARPAVTVREKPLALPSPASSQPSGSILARLSASQAGPTPSSARTTPGAARAEGRDETTQRVDDIMDKTAAKPFSQRYPNANRAKQKRS